uniref:Uncharacterized protein n=1 Tax=Octopus bimaculoides TaxID=37653 RepID=A0A0L8GU86_OCTBM
MSMAVIAHVSLPCNIAVCTQASNDLPFTLRERPFVIHTVMFSEQLPPLLTWSPRYWKLSTTSSLPLWQLMESIFFIFSAFIIPVHLLCVQSLHWVHYMEFLPTPFLQIEQGSVICPPSYLL